MRKDKIDHEFRQLPKMYMDQAKKQTNWIKIEEKINKPKQPNKWMVYSLSTAVFLTFIFISYLFLMEKDKENHLGEWEEIALIFEDIRPFVDITHVNGPINIEYARPIVVGYLYEASKLIDFNGEEIHPIKTENPINQYFDISKENEDFWTDIKYTWVYLNAAQSRLHCEDDERGCIALKEKIDEWIKDLYDIGSIEDFEHNYSIYEKVSIEIASLARAIDHVTLDAVVHEGESDEWIIRIQEINGDHYLGTFIYQGFFDSEYDGVGEVTLTLIDQSGEILTQDTMKLLGAGGTYSSLTITNHIEQYDTLFLVIEWFDSQIDQITLSKQTY